MREGKRQGGSCVKKAPTRPRPAGAPGAQGGKAKAKRKPAALRWHKVIDRPKKRGIYKTSRECLIPEGKKDPIGNGYAEWDGSSWLNYKNWGNHTISCSDGMWYGPVEPPEDVHS